MGDAPIATSVEKSLPVILHGNQSFLIFSDDLSHATGRV